MNQGLKSQKSVPNDTNPSPINVNKVKSFNEI